MLAVVSESSRTGAIMVTGTHRGQHHTYHMRPIRPNRYTSAPREGRVFLWKRAGDAVVELGNYLTTWVGKFARIVMRWWLFVAALNRLLHPERYRYQEQGNQKRRHHRRGARIA